MNDFMLRPPPKIQPMYVPTLRGFLAILVSAAACVALLWWLFIPPDAPKATPRFQFGQIIDTVLGTHRGMIIDIMCYARCVYNVRFSEPASLTDTHVMGSDGPIVSQPLSDMWLEEFEIKGGK